MTIPSPPQGVWNLGPVPLRAYALCIIAGIVVAVWMTERRFVARGGAPGFVIDVAVWAVPFGLIGGRLYHLATDWRTYFGPGGDPVAALYVWNGGLGIWGAIALGGVGAWIACRRRGVPLTGFADAAAPGIVLAQAIGRLGNYFNQELYGAPTTLPWGLEIYRRVDPATGVVDNLGGVALDRTPIEVVQPTFLYELVWNVLVALLVIWADRRFSLARGRAFALYVAGYTLGRFFIEMLRTDPALTRVEGVRVNVIVSGVLCVGALLYLFLARGPREDLAGDPTGSPDDDAGTPGLVTPRDDENDDARAARASRVAASDRDDTETHHGAAEPSGVDAEPEGVQPEEEASATPPSSAHGS
ncbi:prolipoprotein diacylglyceryl transferase [Actinomycetospora sp. Odt1-22]|uniref:Phosphatidylglycerol--prolipoprotein diacylglyceryl transferase n=2 Tax=Actinomycetospora termitidis TaxID=3053470 RepID=A0ABT7MBA4_9PSEU|nr:prolipoprotein diacylglyceryl transferase [Actinomycetospora sp. Odt1-22]MDL5157942.1 prolipoprotein diacylglyceryl transferase [Actinomycetospora sp. Odt1-22]